MFSLSALFGTRKADTSPAPRAAVAAHAPGASVLAGTGRDGGRDETPAADAAQPLGSSVRSFRAPQTVAPAAGPATEGAAGNLPSAHVGQGSPDPRRIWGGTSSAGYPGPKAEGLRPGPVERNVNEPQTAVGKTEQAPPTRPRAGFTGADPARPATYPVATFLRLFDRGMGEQQLAPHGLGKIERPSPIASRPLQVTQVAQPFPSAGGSGPSTGTAALGVQPNTFRLLPEPWDQNAVNVGGPLAGQMPDPAGAAAAAQTRRLRLR